MKAMKKKKSKGFNPLEGAINLFSKGQEMGIF